MKHTPTPYHTRKTFYEGTPIQEIRGEDNYIVGVITEMSDNPELDKANAAFIVRAVNERGALVSALKKANQAIKNLQHTEIYDTSEKIPNIFDVNQEIEALLNEINQQ